MTALPIRQGYALWASSYDEGFNPLIRLETQCLSEILRPAPLGRVLDVATGTGRHAIEFARSGASVIGVDTSPEMLAIAERKRRQLRLDNLRLLRGRLEDSLPVVERAFDLAICALALNHVDDLASAVRHIAAAVRPAGQLVVTDLHPDAVAQGLGTLFTSGSDTYSIRTVPHSTAAYIDAIESAGASVVSVEERQLGQAMARRPSNLPPTIGAEWSHLPFLLVIAAQVRTEGVVR